MKINDDSKRKLKKDPTKYGVRFEYNELFSKLLSLHINQDKNSGDGSLNILHKIKEERSTSEKAGQRYLDRSKTPKSSRKIIDQMRLKPHSPDLNVSLISHRFLLGKSLRTPTAPKLPRIYDFSTNNMAKGRKNKYFNLAEDGKLKLIGKIKTLSLEKLKSKLL